LRLDRAKGLSCHLRDAGPFHHLPQLQRAKPSPPASPFPCIGHDAIKTIPRNRPLFNKSVTEASDILLRSASKDPFGCGGRSTRTADIIIIIIIVALV